MNSGIVDTNRIFIPQHNRSYFEIMRELQTGSKEVHQALIQHRPWLASNLNLVYADYFGIPGDVTQNNTPMNDLKLFFESGFLADHCFIAVTESPRTTTKVKFQQFKHRNLYCVKQHMRLVAEDGHACICTMLYYYARIVRC